MTAYTLWGQSAVPGAAGASAPRTLGAQFSVTWLCSLSAIWWYSPAAAAALPSVCGVWNTATSALVAEDATPAWLTPAGAHATPGAGWVRCDMSAAGVTLPIGPAYAAAVFQPAAVSWYIAQTGYWTTGAGSAGLASGPVHAPAGGASLNGTGCYDASGSWALPGTNPGNGESYYVDLEVAPLTASGHAAAARRRAMR